MRMSSRLLLFGEIVSVYCKNRARLIIKLCGHNVGLDDWGSNILRNVGKIMPYYTASRSKEWQSSVASHWEHQISYCASITKFFLEGGGWIITPTLLLLLGNLFVHRQHHKNQLHYSVMSQFSCILFEVNIFNVSWLRLVTMPLRARSDPRPSRLP